MTANLPESSPLEAAVKENESPAVSTSKTSLLLDSSTSTTSTHSDVTLASLRASLDSLTGQLDCAWEGRRKSLLDSRCRPVGKTQARPTSVPAPLLAAPRKARMRGQNLDVNSSLAPQDLFRLEEDKFEKQEEDEKGQELMRMGSQRKAARLLGLEDLPSNINHLDLDRQDHKEGGNLKSCDQGDLYQQRGSKAARVLGLDQPLVQLVSNKNAISPSTKGGSWEKAARVLGVADNLVSEEDPGARRWKEEEKSKRLAEKEEKVEKRKYSKRRTSLNRQRSKVKEEANPSK